MTSIRNKVTLIGNLGNDPEVKTFSDDKKFARVSVATNETFRNKKGEKVVETTWHSVIMWGNLALITEKIMKKGSEVCVEGKIVNRNWVDKEGVKRFSTEIHAHEVLLLGNKAA
jgi:single-strand DNA-binding protein